MATTAEIRSAPASARRWAAGTRVAFRFCVLYFGLYILITQMFVELILGVYGDSAVFPEVGTIWPMRQLVVWTASRVFHIATPLVIDNSGSGDKIFDWTQSFCLLVVATAGALVWSLVDRARPHCATAARWFRLYVRLALGTTMIAYGMMKVIPTQMPELPLTKLVEPFGQFSPMGVLWTSISASPAYETFAGGAELAAGVLLLLPATTTIGALIALADMVQVFALNMTYDVPVKLFSLHLILLSLVLLAPEAHRLAALRDTGRARRAAVAAQLAFAIYIVAINAWAVRAAWREYGGGRPRSPLAGVWHVDDMRVDGIVRLPLATDRDRWRRLIVDSRAGGDIGAVQRPDDSVAMYRAQIDMGKRSSVLTAGDQAVHATFDRPAPDRLLLEGDVNGHALSLALVLEDRARFPLLTRGFHWVQEYPFNR